MRQKAVSSAPQKVDPTYTLEISANTPKLVELSRTRSSALVSVSSVAVGNSWRRSASTLCSRLGSRSTRPAMNRASRASGKIDSSIW